MDISVDEATAIVAAAQAAYQDKDLDAVLDMYTDDAEIFINAERVAAGRAEIRAWHEKTFDFIREQRMTKTFRAVTGNVIGVQWHADYTNKDGNDWVQDAGEFWTIEGGKLRVWEAHVWQKRI